MQVIERDWNWWAYFWRVIYRSTLKGINEWDKKVVEFIIRVLGCREGDRLLDLGCGSGEHTRLLAQRGIKCTGIDIASSLIRYAKNKAKEQRLRVEYIVDDMRKIDYENEFDFSIMISGTFGFFGDEENLKLLQKISKALKPGGKLFFDIKNIQRKQRYGKSWMAINGGYLLIDTRFDAHNKREIGEYFFIDKKGRINTMAKDIDREGNRIYTLRDIKSLLPRAGLHSVKAYEGYILPAKKYTKSTQSSTIVITARK